MVGCIAGDVLSVQVTAVDTNNKVLANVVTARNAADKLTVPLTDAVAPWIFATGADAFPEA